MKTIKRNVFESLNLAVKITARENQLLDSNKFKVWIDAGNGKCICIDENGNYHFEIIKNITPLINRN